MVADADIRWLSITAVSFATLCMLFGIYFMLFWMSLWATYRREGRAYKRLRMVTIILFINLTLHLSAQALLFARSRIIPAPAGEGQKWTIPLGVFQGLTSTIAGLISDGLLAWRFYVIFKRSPWARWLPTSLITINTLLAFSANLLPLAVYSDIDFFNAKLHELSLDILAAWGWCMFGVHTLLTGSVIWRILYTYRLDRSCRPFIKSDLPPSPSSVQYTDIVEALIESALVTWIGLLLYEITSFAPSGHITTSLDVGYVFGSILPVFFGISQCLITVRLGYADMYYLHQANTLVRSPTTAGPHEIVVQVERETHNDAKEDLERPLNRNPLRVTI